MSVILEATADSAGWIRAAAMGALGLHIAGGCVAIAAGYGALVGRKGGRTHRVSGQVFMAAMLVMVFFAAVLGLFNGQQGNVIAALFAFYLIGTAWLAVRQPPQRVSRLDRAAVALALGIAALSLLGLLNPSDNPDTPAGASVVFAVIVGLAASLDLQVIRRGGLAGLQRIRRHLWRMCTALFVATGSAFLGQMDEIAQSMRGPHLWLLAFAPLGALAFWMWRMRERRRPRNAPNTAAPVAAQARA